MCTSLVSVRVDMSHYVRTSRGAAGAGGQRGRDAAHAAVRRRRVGAARDLPAHRLQRARLGDAPAPAQQEEDHRTEVALVEYSLACEIIASAWFA